MQSSLCRSVVLCCKLFLPLFRIAVGPWRKKSRGVVAAGLKNGYEQVACFACNSFRANGFERAASLLFSNTDYTTLERSIHFTMNDTFKISFLIFVLLAAVASCIQGPYPQEQLLQQIGTLLLCLLLFANRKIRGMSRFSYICIGIFTLLHIVAARYLYSYVPYNAWIRSLTGFDIDQAFHFERNQFDRLVHFSFGCLALPVLFERIDRRRQLPASYRLWMAWLMLQTFSMLYELFEWSLTMVMTGESADYYNGQQGDIWDAQKDMAWALAGSLLCMLLLWANKSLRYTLSSKRNR